MKGIKGIIETSYFFTVIPGRVKRRPGIQHLKVIKALTQGYAEDNPTGKQYRLNKILNPKMRPQGSDALLGFRACNPLFKGTLLSAR
jgi:hypothetical protein